MSSGIPRVRMFAGPNGSGKSTIKEAVRPEIWGIYINPDEIEQEIRSSGSFDLAVHGISATSAELQAFFKDSTLTPKAGIAAAIASVEVIDGKIDFSKVEMNGYWPSLASDFLRHKLLEVGATFTFETVMSSADKVEFLEKAQDLGYRTYLYYVATEDPEINVARVESRVKNGGHSVPEDKIKSRYDRSLDLLFNAMKASDRAYIFDNSKALGENFLVAELDDQGILTIMTDEGVPAWFQRAVLDKLPPDAAIPNEA